MTAKTFLDGKVTLYAGDCVEVLASLPEASVDSVVCDPPYHLTSIVKRFGADGAAPAKVGKTGAYARASAGFMGKQWDGGDVAFRVEMWAQAFRVLKPGGHLVAFSGTRTYHRMVCAIEDAGFEIRDCLFWHYGSGFPKSHDVGKRLDAAGQRCSCGREAEAIALQSAADGSMRGLRQDEDDAASVAAQGAKPDMLPSMQRGATRGRVGKARTQGGGGTQDVHAIDGRREPGMEGRGHLPQEARQLRVGEVREMPARVHLNGAEGRLCDGASAGNGEMGRAAPAAQGMRAPQGPQPPEQRAGQSGIMAMQPNAQASGAWPACGRCGKPIVPDGLGTALKPSTEPICLARKPLIGTVAENVLKHGTGAINVDGCRVETGDDLNGGAYVGGKRQRDEYTSTDTIEGAVPLSRLNRGIGEYQQPVGRWPANLIHDGSEEVLKAFPSDAGGGARPAKRNGIGFHGGNGTDDGVRIEMDDGGSAARFFYTAKADSEDRLGSKHPTVKPIDLMQWLVRLVTPKGGVVLDPFAGTGTTGEAAWREGMRAILIEREEEYLADIARRMELATQPTKRAAVAKTKNKLERPEDLPLFAAGD